MTVAEVAEACRLSERAVYRAIEAGELPATRLRSRIRICQSDFDGWLTAGRVEPPGRHQSDTLVAGSQGQFAALLAEHREA